MEAVLEKYEGLSAEQRKAQYVQDRKLVQAALKTQFRFFVKH